MATRPIQCPYQNGEGLKMHRGNLVYDSGESNNFPIYLGLSDFLFETSAFSKSKINLGGSKSFLLSQTDICDPLGYASLFVAIAKFPENTLESKKYLYWTYRGNEYNMGEILALSGKMISSVDSLPAGWIISKPGTNTDLGGILFVNPHDFNIKMEFLVCR